LSEFGVGFVIPDLLVSLIAFVNPQSNSRSLTHSADLSAVFCFRNSRTFPEALFASRWFVLKVILTHRCFAAFLKLVAKPPSQLLPDCCLLFLIKVCSFPK
jgi:hypothetical protein